MSINKEKYSNNTLSVLVRVHSTQQKTIMNLEACIFMLFNQQYKPTEVVFCLQRLSNDDVEVIKNIVNSYPWSDAGHPLPVFINVFDSERKDIRSKLINEGIAAASGRFIAMLDYDDIIYGNAYTHLISGLLSTESAIAFGGIRRVDVMPFRQFNYRMRKFDVFHGKDKFDMFYTNFCPIHSFVLDRSRVRPEDIYFEEFLSKNEDYDFLLRILSKYDANFQTRNKMVGEYQVRTDGSNTIGSEYRSDPVADAEWKEAVEHIHQLMKKLTVNVSMWDIHLLKSEAKSRPIPIEAAGSHLTPTEDISLGAAHLSTKLQIASDFINAKVGPFPHVRKNNLKGFVEEINMQDDGSVCIKGWAADTAVRTGVKGVAVCYDGKVIAIDSAEILRPDVQVHHDLVDDHCGFNIIVKKDDIKIDTTLRKNLVVFAMSNDNGIFKLEFLKNLSLN